MRGRGRTDRGCARARREGGAPGAARSGFDAEPPAPLGPSAEHVPSPPRTGQWGLPASGGTGNRTPTRTRNNPGMSRASVRLPLAGVAFLALADTAIVALALPPILRDLDTDVAGVAAVLGVYAVVLALALMPAERLGRTRGLPEVGVTGVALFAAGSLICGL